MVVYVLWEHTTWVRFPALRPIQPIQGKLANSGQIKNPPQANPVTRTPKGGFLIASCFRYRLLPARP